MSSPQARQRRSARAAAVLISLTAAAAVLVPVAYVTTEPGPVFDVLGEADGQAVVQIEGAATYPTTGRLDMVTVLQSGGTSPLGMGSAMLAWLLPNRSVEPKDVRYPPGSEPGTEEQIDEAVFQASTSSALAAAATTLGRPVNSAALVSYVEPGAPADGALEAGDQITAVNGEPTDTAEAVASEVRSKPAGAEITVDYIRDGAPARSTIATAAREDGAEGAYIGIVLVDSYTSNFTADVALDGIGGPSAGMVFSLAMVDQLTPGELLGGAHVAGTGTIDAAGNVGPIGGIDKKVISVGRAGAGLFLVPRDNCADLAGGIPSGLTVVPVDTLDAAVDSVTAWRSGSKDLPACT